jgi:hypothetical protein
VGEAQAGFAILAYGMRFSSTYTTQTQEFQGSMAACISSARLPYR